MVNFKEMFNPQRMVTKLGAISFPANIFKEDRRTPHYEMEKSLEMYMTRPMINSGVKQFARFIIGEGLEATSSDQKTHDFLNKWLDLRSGIQAEVLNMVITGVCAGNIFAERTWKQMANGNWVIDNLYNINDCSRCYINMDNDKQDADQYWLYELPIEVKRFPFGTGDNRVNETPKFWKVNYVYGSYMWSKMVWAIPIHKSKVAHLKLGWSKDGIYGRSFLASSIDDGEILTEILKNYAIIARYRALGKKIFSIGTPDDPAGPDDIDKLEADLLSIEDRNHIIINKELKGEPLSYTGENDAMDFQLDFLRKDMTSGIIPNFLTPWNNEVNRATAGEVKIPFQLEVDSYKESIIQFLNRVIIDELRKEYTFLSEDASFTFGNVDLDSRDEKMGYATNMYQANAITLNEYRTTAGYDAIEGGDQFVTDLSTPEDASQFFSADTDGSFKEGLVGNKEVENKVKAFLIKNPNPTDKQVHQLADDLQVDTDELESVFYKFATKGVKKEALGQDVQSVTNDDEKWKQKLFRQGTLNKKLDNKIVRSANIRGQRLRMIKNEDEYIIFDGIEPLKQFELDEGDIAQSYYKKIKTKRVKALDEFYEGELPEDKIMEDFYKDIKRLNAEVIDEVFKDLPQNKVKLESLFAEKTGLNPTALANLTGIFAKFNDKIKDIVSKVTGGLVGIVTNPKIKIGLDPDAPDSIMPELDQKAQILKQRMEQQLETMNQDMKNKVFRQMSDGIASGQSVNEIKQNLKDQFANFKTKENPQDWQIARVVRTELANANAMMKLSKWKEMGFDKVQHITVVDDKTGDKDRRFNRRVFDIDFLLKTEDDRIPLHPNCRCQYVAYE